MAATPAELWAKAQLDPSVLAGKGGLRDALIRAVTGYGDASSIFARQPGVDPSTGKPYQTLAEQYGIDQNAVSGAASNPYSTLHGLADQSTSNRHNIVGGLASRGLEFGGAMAASQAHETQQAGQRNYAAEQGLQGALGGIGQQYTGLITGAYNTLMQQAANDPAIPAAPAPAPEAAAPEAPAPAAAAAPPPMNGLGQPWIDPGARENLVQPPPAPTPKALSAAQLAAQAKRGFQGHA